MRRIDLDAACGLTPTADATKSTIENASDDARAVVALVEGRALIRDCLARCITADFGSPVIAFPNLESLRAATDLRPALIVISACRGGAEPSGAALRGFSHADLGAPVIILSDGDEIDDVASTLRMGASGHVPTGASFQVAIEAMRLVQVGGVFVPGSALLAQKGRLAEFAEEQKISFTERQNAVLGALCMGKSNKLIAYELAMSESTVKVHVRNIMKKLQAKNRTEVAVRMGCAQRRRPSLTPIAEPPGPSMSEPDTRPEGSLDGSAAHC
jgi:DNA-binding NarL/FixJ family response regulator